MRCKSIQTIAQGDAQSESSQSQGSTGEKMGIQKLNSTEKEQGGIFGGFAPHSSCSHQTSEFHLPASEKEKVFVFSRPLLLDVFLFYFIYLLFLEIYLCIEILGTRTPRNKFNCWGVCVIMVTRERGKKRGGASKRMLTILFMFALNLSSLFASDNSHPDVFRLNILLRNQLIWFNTLKL